MKLYIDKKVCIIFVKYPEPGRVKTRLAKGSNPTFATKFYRLCCEQTIRRLSSRDEWTCLIAYAPTTAEVSIKGWLEGISKELHYSPQIEDPDLGERMSGSIRSCLSEGAQKVVLVGSDIPSLDEHAINRAFAALDTAEVVFGPAEDGGFYLVGGRLLPQAVLQGIEWSRSTVLEATKQNCERAGLTFDTHSLPALQDIDTIEDLKKWLDVDPVGPLQEAITKLLKNL